MPSVHAAKSRHTGLAKLPPRHAHAGLWRRGALSNLCEEPPRVFRQAAKQHVTCAQAHHCAQHKLGAEHCRTRASSEWRLRQGATRTRQPCRRSRVQAPPSTTPHKITSQRTHILHVLPYIRLTPIRPARPSGRGRTACQVAVQDPACMQKRHAGRDVARDAEHGRQARAAGGVPSVFQKLARLDGSLRGRKREPRR